MHLVSVNACVWKHNYHPDIISEDVVKIETISKLHDLFTCPGLLIQQYGCLTGNLNSTWHKRKSKHQYSDLVDDDITPNYTY